MENGVGGHDDGKNERWSRQQQALELVLVFGPGPCLHGLIVGPSRA